MLHFVDATLATLLSRELVRLPGCPVREPEQVTFDPPSEAEAAMDGVARVNLFLFDVRENLHRRSMGQQTVRPGSAANTTAGIRPLPIWLDLSYLITAHAGRDPLTEHRLLAEALGVLLRHRVPKKEYLAGVLSDLDPALVTLTVAQGDAPAFGDPKALWQSVGGSLRPMLSLVVSLPFDPFETVWTKVAREAVVAMGPQDASGKAQSLELSHSRPLVSGIVLDQETELPLARATVSLVEVGRDTITDTSGLFAIFGNTSEALMAHTLRVNGNTYREEERTIPAPSLPPGKRDAATVEMLPDPEPLVIALRRASDRERVDQAARDAEAFQNSPGVLDAGRTRTLSAHGIVLRPDGTPAAYVPVRAGDRRTVTDGSGTFQFFDLENPDVPIFADIPGVGEVEVSRAPKAG